MKTITVTTTSYVEVDDDASDADAEAIVEDALIGQHEVFLVTVNRDSVLFSL